MTWKQLRRGIRIKHLAKDEKRGIQIDLIRLEPGLDDPPHWHNDWEWVYILEGSLEDEKGVHRAGDFMVNEKDSRHQPKTKEGCTALIVWCGSVRNEP